MSRQDRLDDQLLEELNNFGAGEDNDFSTIAKLIKDGADPNVTNWDGWNALHRVAFFEFDCPRELLLTIVNKINNINAVSIYEKRTALMEAASEDNLTMVSMLKNIRSDIDPNVQDRYKQTALHLAARITSGKMIELLLSFDGIDIDLKDDDQFTPLDLARKLGHSRCVELLENHQSQISEFKF